MTYELIITERAAEQMAQLTEYLLLEIKSRTAAVHLIDGISDIYDRLLTLPFQFPLCEDPYLKQKGYRKAKIPDMSYVVIFQIRESTIAVLGIFHELESYGGKL